MSLPFLWKNCCCYLSTFLDFSLKTTHQMECLLNAYWTGMGDKVLDQNWAAESIRVWLVGQRPLHGCFFHIPSLDSSNNCVRCNIWHMLDARSAFDCRKGAVSSCHNSGSPGPVEKLPWPYSHAGSNQSLPAPPAPIFARAWTPSRCSWQGKCWS